MRSLGNTLATSALCAHSRCLICSARRASAAARFSGATLFGSTSFWAKPGSLRASAMTKLIRQIDFKATPAKAPASQVYPGPGRAHMNQITPRLAGQAYPVEELRRSHLPRHCERSDLSAEAESNHPRRPGLEPGPITTNLNCCAMLGPPSRRLRAPVVMGPSLRRDDVELNSPCSCAAAEGERRSLRLCLAVLVELRNIGPEVVDLFLVLDAGKRHLGAGDLRLGVLDVFLELRLVPGDARILVGVGVGIIRRGAGLAAVEPVQLRADLVLGAFADRVAGQAFVERGLAGRDVLRKGRGCDRRRCNNDQRAQNEIFHWGALRGFQMRKGRRCHRRCGTAGLQWTSREMVPGFIDQP